MSRDVMTWIGRLVGGVFALGVLALAGAVVVMIRQAQGVPPWPVFMGVVALVLLILLAGACLALISIAVSARRGAAALQAMTVGAGLAPSGIARVEEAPEAPAPMQAPARGPLSPSGLAEAPEPRVAPRPARVLVAER